MPIRQVTVRPETGHAGFVPAGVTVEGSVPVSTTDIAGLRPWLVTVAV